METEERTTFRNTTRGWISVVRVDKRGNEKAEPLAGGETVRLTEEEQQLTIRQHRDPAVSNPFIDHDYEITNPETGEVLEAGRRPVLQRVGDDEPLPTAPAGEPEGGEPEAAAGGDAKGQFVEGEETGVPPT